VLASLTRESEASAILHIFLIARIADTILKNYYNNNLVKLLNQACLIPKFTSKWVSLMFLCGVMLFSAFDSFAASPAMQVSGTVTDANGGGLPGVSVLVKGTITGTVTDDNGKFNISVPDGNAVLVFSSVGFTTQEIAVGGKSTIDVILTEGEALQKVVVVGYGTQRKVDLTGAVSSISSKDLNGKPATSMD
jgi:CarboxypepD_reg-like domain